MSPTSDEPTSDSGGARLRAKARVGTPRIRPEVSDALGDLEQSLVDVATWERLQPSPLDPGPTDADPGDDDADVDDPELDDDVDEVDDDHEMPPIPLIPPPPGAPGSTIPPPPGAPPLSGIAFSPPGGHGADESPLLSRFVGEDALDDLRITGPVLPAAAGVAQKATATDEAAEEARRRRRNGRILSWAGVVLLASVGLLWWLPNLSKDDKTDLPTVDPNSSTTEDSLLLNPDDLTSTTEATTTTVAVTEAPVVTAGPTTTKKKSTTVTTKKAATTTTVATPGPTSPTTPTTVFVPSSIRTPGPPVTTTTAPAVTTTSPTVP